MFKKGQYAYYNNKMVQIADAQDDELVYVIVLRKPFTPPDTVWANYDEVKPLCPSCDEPSEFDTDGDILLCSKCANYVSESIDHADHLNRCDW